MEAQDNDGQSKVIQMFKYYDCLDSTLVSKQKFIYILNKQANIHLHHNFSPSIVEEIWGQAETTSTGDSSVYTISKIYSQAMKIL
jgi:Ca2+-binding EF-hand superfamily protein